MWQNRFCGADPSEMNENPTHQFTHSCSFAKVLYNVARRQSVASRGVPTTSSLRKSRIFLLWLEGWGVQVVGEAPSRTSFRKPAR